MSRSNGFRRKTRKLFKKKFKTRGLPTHSSIVQNFRVGDYVDCIVNPSVQKNMPHKIYHGKTGRILEIMVRNYVVLFYIKEKGKFYERAIRIRNEHLRKSRCDEFHKNLVEINYLAKIEAESKGEKYQPIKYFVEGPREAISINLKNVEYVELKNKPFIKTY